jgi:pyruvate-ferredoxin/flavodoxin oxidoreductase
VDGNGRGPTWSNSLFEDNAEFAFGMRLAVDKQADLAADLLKRLAGSVGDDLVAALLSADQVEEAGIVEQRKRVAVLKEKLAAVKAPDARMLERVADYLVRKSVWALGGDGWAYDIGYGGLDHVLAMNRNVNILVMDTEVYSNTGGQASKSTPLGASAKFAMAGKAVPKKDLSLMAIAYGNVYVAHVAFGAKDQQTVQAFKEADGYDGPSIIIAYSHCIAHGYDLANGLEQQRLAVDCGHWPLFRYDPRLAAAGKNPLQMDSAPPKSALSAYVGNETRYRMVEQMNPEHFKELMAAAQREVTNRYALYEHLARMAGPEAVAAPRAD